MTRKAILWPQIVAVHAVLASAAVCNIETRDGAGLTATSFAAEFVGRRKPVILSNLWPTWTNESFEAGIDRLEATFGDFTISAPWNDLVPVEDWAWVSKENYKAEFSIPSLFTDDALAVCYDDDSFLQNYRYRWLLFGSKHGSAFHFDPLNTSAWNVVHFGSGELVCYPKPVL